MFVSFTIIAFIFASTTWFLSTMIRRLNQVDSSMKHIKDDLEDLMAQLNRVDDKLEQVDQLVDFLSAQLVTVDTNAETRFKNLKEEIENKPKSLFRKKIEVLRTNSVETPDVETLNNPMEFFELSERVAEFHQTNK